MNPRRQPWMHGHLVVFKNGIERQGRDIRPAYSRDERELIYATDMAIFKARRTSSAGYIRRWKS